MAPHNRPQYRISLGKTLKLPAGEARRIKQAVCEYVAGGYTLNEAAEKVGLPNGATILALMRSDPEFRAMFREAKEMYYALVADELIEIADTASLRTLPIARERIATRQWILERAMRAVWGSSSSVTLRGDPEAPVQVLTFDERLERLRSIFAVAAQRLTVAPADPAALPADGDDLWS